MLWKKVTHEDLQLDPEQWSWKLDGTTLTPVMTGIAAAPETLLKFVRCKCKLSSRNPCGTNICFCQKKLSQMCKLLVGTTEEKIVEMLRTLFLHQKKKRLAWKVKIHYRSNFTTFTNHPLN